MTGTSKASEAAALMAEMVERDDRLFQLGLCDDANGPFPSRAFAESVARTETRHLPQWGHQ
jgi:hypothetical protein